jgi:hypothetical protein
MATKKQQAQAARVAERRAAMKWAVESVTPEIILAITCVVLGAAIAMLVFAGYGFRLGERNQANKLGYSEPNSTNVSVINIDYKTEVFEYDADQNCIDGTSSEKCLLDLYGAKNSDFAIISSSDQINRLMGTLSGITGQNYESKIDTSIFNAGSVIAISGPAGYADYTLTNAYRDENYGLHFQTKTVVTDTANLRTGHLILVSVPNIQTRQVVVVNEEL